MKIDYDFDLAQGIKELRELTGAGLLECKTALILHGGDTERALETLRKRGRGPAEPEPEVVN